MHLQKALHKVVIVGRISAMVQPTRAATVSKQPHLFGGDACYDESLKHVCLKAEKSQSHVNTPFHVGMDQAGCDGVGKGPPLETCPCYSCTEVLVNGPCPLGVQNPDSSCHGEF